MDQRGELKEESKAERQEIVMKKTTHRPNLGQMAPELMSFIEKPKDKARATNLRHWVYFN